MENAHDKSSAFRRYSKGIVAENMGINDTSCEILLLEVNPAVDGDLAANLTKINSTITHPNGRKVHASINVSNTVKAKWYPINCGNRVTPPNMRRGEPVTVYTVADSDDFYFVDESSPEKKRLETIIHQISATSDESATLSASNTYQFTASSHYGIISINTSKANGEPFAWGFQFDLKNGNWMVSDDNNNHIGIDSRSGTIQLTNSTGSTIYVQGDTATVSANNINIIAKANLLLQAAKITLKGLISMVTK